MAAKNICECEHPPGGTTECDINQTAYCIVKDGIARHICVTPEGANNLQQLVAIYTFVTGSKPARANALTLSMVKFLRSGKYIDRNERTIISFSLPSYLTDYLDDLEGGSSGDGPTPVKPITPSPQHLRRRRAETQRITKRPSKAKGALKGKPKGGPGRTKVFK